MKLSFIVKWKALSRSVKWIFGAILSVLIIFGVWGYQRYLAVFKVNVTKSGILYIHTGSGFQQVLDSLKRGGYL